MTSRSMSASYLVSRGASPNGAPALSSCVINLTVFILWIFLTNFFLSLSMSAILWPSMHVNLTICDKNRLYLILDTFPFAASMSSARTTSVNVSLEISSRTESII